MGNEKVPIPFLYINKRKVIGYMSKKIIEISLIVFAMVFIVIMVTIFGGVLDIGNQNINSLTDIQNLIVEADLEGYNDTIVSGDTVISTINKLKETKNGFKLSYAVCSGAASSSGNWRYYGYGGLEYSSSVGASGDYIGVGESSTEYKSYKTSLKPGDSGYISPVQEYRCRVVVNINGVVSGIAFIEV